MSLLVAVACVDCSRSQDREQPQGSLRSAPDFSMEAMDGVTWTLSSQRGKVVLVNFWGTWCGPCRREQPVLSDTYVELQDKGLQIFGVAIESTDLAVELWAENLGVPYPLLQPGDEDSLAIDLYGFEGIPFSVLIDRRGYIRKEYQGIPDAGQLVKDIEQVLVQGS